MELGSWSLIQAPSLLALIPLALMIVLAFKGFHNAFACFAGIVLAALMMGQDPGNVANALKTSMGTTTALIGMIIMMGAGLGNLMTESGVTKTLVYWIVKRIGVNTQAQGQNMPDYLLCYNLRPARYIGRGNAVIAPILLPIMASLGVCPSAVACLFKIAGEIGLMVGPLTGVTLITMEVTGLSYGQLMLQAVLPFSIFWLAGAWLGANHVQKKLQGKEYYEVTTDIKNLDSVVISAEDSRNTVIFLAAFFLLVLYGILSKQGTAYALIVMIILEAVVAICTRMKVDHAMNAIIKGVASQAGMFLVFITIEALLSYVTLGGGFEALSNLLGGFAGDSPTAVMLIASLVGGFGIEAAAVAEIKIISGMFGELALTTGLPMGCFAVSILAATRLTGSAYPTSNFAGQIGIAHCDNTKEALKACWMSVIFAAAFVVFYAFVGPMILS